MTLQLLINLEKMVGPFYGPLS